MGIKSLDLHQIILYLKFKIRKKKQTNKQTPVNILLSKGLVQIQRYIVIIKDIHTDFNWRERERGRERTSICIGLVWATTIAISLWKYTLEVDNFMFSILVP